MSDQNTAEQATAAARATVAAYETDARVLGRKPKHELLAIFRSELAARGAASLMAHNYSKDELLRAILDDRHGWTAYLAARDVITAAGMGVTVAELNRMRGTEVIEYPPADAYARGAGYRGP